jgi:hypothetical protein
MATNMRRVIHVLRDSRLCLPCLSQRAELTEADVRQELGKISSLLLITFAPAYCEGCGVLKSVASSK